MFVQEAQESSVGVGKGPTGVAHASPATIAQHSAQDIAGAGLRKHAVDSHTAGSASTSGQVSQGNEAVQSPEQVHLQLPIDVTGSNNLSNAAYTEDSAASASFSKAQGGVGDPVDMNHLQSLLETEGFGQSKFADLQGRMQSSTAEPRQRASVEDLFASELGPVNSRFAKPKTSAQLQAHASASGKGSSSANTQGLGKRTAADAALAGVSVLVLSITHGPAAGTVFVADDGSKEVRFKMG